MTNTTVSVAFRLATTADSHLECYDNTKLVAFNTCPTWGVVRYAKHLRMPRAGRSMALEAGTAMHEVFSYVRLMTLEQQLLDSRLGLSHIDTLITHHGVRLFGEQRWRDIIDNVPDNETWFDQVKHGCLSVLETGGFYDDDRDKRRTMTNLETAALVYCDRWNWKHHVWMRSEGNPLTDVGIEIPYDIVVEPNDMQPFRFTGKLDGIRWHGSTLVIEDNKTASRLNDAWESSMDTTSQFTGYVFAASLFTEHHIRNAEGIGLAIPIPKSEFNGYVRAPVTRTENQVQRWLAWMLTTVQGYRDNADPTTTQQYTHSCNRYFRPCSLIPFCVSTPEEQHDILQDMEVDEWSPLHSSTNTEGDG